MLGVLISKEEYDEYQRLKKKNTPMKKIDCRWNRRCDGVIDISDMDLVLEEKAELKEILRKEGFYNTNE